MTEETENQRALIDGSFRARDEYCERFTHRLLPYLQTDKPVRVLDIGCGTGSQIFALARVLPDASFTGVDLSEANIALARQTAAQLAHSDRIRFVAGDYMGLEEPPFDLIVSYSTLHLIPGSTQILLAKLSRDLAPGGLLANVMPYECLYNTLLMGVRKLFRIVRGEWTDRLLFLAAKTLTKDNLMDEKMLRERLLYMYLLPHRLNGANLRQVAEKFDLYRIAEHFEPYVSLAQPKHNAVFFRKRSEFV